MIICLHRYQSSQIKLVLRWIFSFLIISSIFLWLLGLSDHIFAKSFSNFKWMPLVDVKKQVLLELNGERPTEAYENDWANFRAIIEPSCAANNHSNMKQVVLIVVKSAIQNLLKRNAIRSTWGAITSYDDFIVRTIFVLGHQPSERLVSDVLKTEIINNQDILLGDYIDHYWNNTYKLLSAIQYTYECSAVAHENVSFSLFVDDDYLVIIQNLMAELKKHTAQERLYMGWRFDTRPFRLIFQKHRIPLSVYPFDRYPPYVSAGAVILSWQSLHEIYYGIQYTRIFIFDDIYMGILAHTLGIPVIHNAKMHFWQRPISWSTARTLICAHGFEAKELRAEYNTLNLKGLW